MVPSCAYGSEHRWRDTDSRSRTASNRGERRTQANIAGDYGATQSYRLHEMCPARLGGRLGGPYHAGDCQVPEEPPFPRRTSTGLRHITRAAIAVRQTFRRESCVTNLLLCCSCRGC